MAKQSYYSSRKSQLLKDFDKTANLVRSSIISKYGPDYANTLYRDTRQEYETLIPQIPHIDGRLCIINAFCIKGQGVVSKVFASKVGCANIITR